LEGFDRLKYVMYALVVVTLAGCGADGEPIQPVVNGTVTVNNSGVHSQIGVGATRGPVTVQLGF
jgi:hypothetical protein